MYVHVRSFIAAGLDYGPKELCVIVPDASKVWCAERLLLDSLQEHVHLVKSRALSPLQPTEIKPAASQQ